MSARRLADKLRKTEKNGVLFADQWNNLDNRKAHYVSTGPEIWEETGGKVDGFICSVGTGGTLAGTSIFLREKKKDIVIGVADPRGAAMYNLFAHGEAKATEGGSITEGIGLGRVTPIIEDIKVDKAYLIPDEEAVPIIFDLLEHEGLCLGGSSGINVAGAIRLAKDLGPGHTIVTVLCRLRHALPVEAVQPGIPALEEAAGAGLARAQESNIKTRSRRPELRMPTDCLFRDDSYLKDCDGARRRRHRARRHRARPHRVLRRLRRPARRHAARSPRPTARTIADRQRGLHRPGQDRDRPCAGAGRAGRSRSATPSPPRSTGTCATPACACTPRCICSPRCCPIPVTGGSVGDAESRLDFDIPGSRPRQGRHHRKARRDDRDRRRGDRAAGSATPSSKPIPAWSRPCR